MRERSRILFAFLGGALAWTLHLMGAYFLSEAFCRSGLEQVSLLGFSVMIWGLGLLTLLSLSVTSASLWTARRLHIASLADIRAGQGNVYLFMASSSLLNNILFMAIIIAQTLPILIPGEELLMGFPLGWAVLLLVPEAAWAHGKTSSHDVVGWYAVIGGNLSLISFFYVRGWQRKAHREWWSLFLFVGGIIATLAALLPPIDLLSEELLSIHMIQHMLLMMVASPLFVFSYSDFFIRMGFSNSGRRKIWKIQRSLTGRGLLRVTRPLLIAGLYALVLWIWHLPLLYESALGNRWIHNVQHLAFFMSSYFFWKVLLRRIGRPALNSAAGIIYLFVTSLHSTALGVLMALSPQTWYSFYAHTTGAHGLTAIEDQQLAGYIMWMPAGFSYVLIAAWLTFRLVRDPNESTIKSF